MRISDWSSDVCSSDLEEMTVRENLLVAADPKSPWRYLLDLVRPGVQPSTTVIEDVVRDLDLPEHLDRRPSELPQGIARMVGIARAIAAEPRVLLLDEPAAGQIGRAHV